MAIITIPPKQMKIPIISIRRIRSFRQQQASIEIQKGLVCMIITTKLIGSKVNAKFCKAKLTCPANDRITKSLYSVFGKPLNGFCFLHNTIEQASPPIHTLRKNKSSMTETVPSSATHLNMAPEVVAKSAKQFIKMIAFHLLSFLTWFASAGCSF